MQNEFNCSEFNNIDRKIRELSDQFSFCSKGYFWCRDTDQVLDNLGYSGSRVFGLNYMAAIEILDQVYPEIFSDCKNISDKTCKFVSFMNVWTCIIAHIFTSDRLMINAIWDLVNGIHLVSESKEGNPFMTFASYRFPTGTRNESAKNEKLITELVDRLIRWDHLTMHDGGTSCYLTIDKILETEEIEWCGEKVRLLHAAHVYATMQYITFKAKQLAIKNGMKHGDSLCSFRERYLLQKKIDTDPLEVYLQFIPIALEPWMYTINPRFDTVQHPTIVTNPLNMYHMID